MINSLYVEWLKKQRVPLFEGGGIYWRMYQGALVPAYAYPCFVELSHSEAKNLLKKSGARFIRYASEPLEIETEWWYVICDSYNPDKISSNTRSKINRGFRNCYIRRIDAEWLANHGYECYFAAFNRYKNAIPVEKNIFRNNILTTIEGPFEYWGCFVKDNLAGYCQCILENNEASTNVIKFHPAYLKYYASYALITSMVDYYVTQKGMTISNGTRSIAHDTTFQDFLLKLGFRKQFCYLKIVYQPWLRIILQTLFFLRRFLILLPDFNAMHKLNALIYQEEIHRACNDR
jgi:hypothetical protein